MARRFLSQCFVQNCRLLNLSAGNIFDRRTAGTHSIDVYRCVSRIDGGGIKTSTFFVLIQGIKSAATNKSEKAFHNAIPKDSFRKASVITLLAVAVVSVGIWLMVVLEPDVSLTDALLRLRAPLERLVFQQELQPVWALGQSSSLFLLCT